MTEPQAAPVVPAPVELPCIGDLWRMVGYVSDILPMAGVARNNLAWHISPYMLRKMTMQPEFREVLSPDIMSGVVTWTLFGLPVIPTASVVHPMLTITMDCVQEYPS